MRILVLTSRYTATRDIISEDFGRQIRIFASLKKLKYKIDFLCSDYRKYENSDTKLHGINIAIRPFGIFHFFSFIKSLDNKLKAKRYDFLIATSDPLWGVIGYLFAKKHKIRFIYDLHDNYETYTTYKIPFLKYLDKYVIKKSDIITTVSYTLKDKISKIRKTNVLVIQNGVDTRLFRPMNKLQCRRELKLPENTKIIAYAGSIQRLQGIGFLIGVFNKLKEEFRDLKLVIAGRFFKGEEKYINLNQKDLIYLKSLPQDMVVKLINAADVVVVPNPENNFTKYCFPYKVVEYMSCNKPIVATNVGDINILLKDFKDSLCEENDDEDMAKKIKNQLTKKSINYRTIALKNSWDNIAMKLDKILKNNMD